MKSVEVEAWQGKGGGWEQGPRSHGNDWHSPGEVESWRNAAWRDSRSLPGLSHLLCLGPASPWAGPTRGSPAGLNSVFRRPLSAETSSGLSKWGMGLPRPCCLLPPASSCVSRPGNPFPASCPGPSWTLLILSLPANSTISFYPTVGLSLSLTWTIMGLSNSSRDIQPMPEQSAPPGVLTPLRILPWVPFFKSLTSRPRHPVVHHCLSFGHTERPPALCPCASACRSHLCHHHSKSYLLGSVCKTQSQTGIRTSPSSEVGPPLWHSCTCCLSPS